MSEQQHIDRVEHDEVVEKRVGVKGDRQPLSMPIWPGCGI